MSQDFRKLGEEFRRKREEMNLTLKEVENATSIRSMYLEAIEHGKPSEYLSPVYTMGFIRQYASFLDLDIARMIQDYPAAFKIRREKQDFDYGIGTLERRNSSSGSIRGMSNRTLVFTIGAILLGAWYFGKFVGVF